MTINRRTEDSLQLDLVHVDQLEETKIKLTLFCTASMYTMVTQ